MIIGIETEPKENVIEAHKKRVDEALRTEWELLEEIRKGKLTSLHLRNLEEAVWTTITLYCEELGKKRILRIGDFRLSLPSKSIY